MRYLGKRKLVKPKSGYIDDAADALAVAICHYLKISNMERLTEKQKGVIKRGKRDKGAKGEKSTRGKASNKGK